MRHLYAKSIRKKLRELVGTGWFRVCDLPACYFAFRAASTRQITGEIAGEVQKFLKILHTPMSRSEAQSALNLKGQANFRDRYLKPALDLELVEMTIPDKPKSRLQKYRDSEGA